MTISLVGKGAETLLQLFSQNEVPYERPRPAVGSVVNSAHVMIRIAEAVPIATIAIALGAWVRAWGSRKVIVTTHDNTVVHAEGYSVAEVEQILAQAKSVMAAETKKPEATMINNQEVSSTREGE